MSRRSWLLAVGALALVVFSFCVPLILGRFDPVSPSQAFYGPDDLIPAAQAAAETSPAYLAGSWVPTGGPTGGLGYDVRMDPEKPDAMYVTDAYAGAFKSLDQGRTWFPINDGISTRIGEAIPVFSLTIDPNNPNTIWLGTQYSSDIYRSDNAGDSWTLKKNGIAETQLSVRGFTVEPGNSNIVYFGAEVSSWEWNGSPLPGLGLDMTKGVVYKSIDRGESWNKIWEGDNLARYIWINPQNPAQIFVSTGIFDREAANSDPVNFIPAGVGLLRSQNGGQTWEELDESNGFDPDELYIGSLYMQPGSPNVLLAAAGNDPYTPFLGRELGGIYRTADGGDSWTEVLGPHNFSAVEFCEGAPQIAYAGSLAGFFRSEDGGQTWAETGGSVWGPPGIVAGFPIDIHCDPRDPQRLFVNNYGGGNFLSEDGGFTWAISSQGYTGALMRGLAIAENNPGVVYAAARSGLFYSPNGGGVWAGISNGMARQLDALAIALDPDSPSHLLASLADVGPNPLESLDGGQTWSLVNTGIIFPQGNNLTDIQFAPSNGQVIYAAVGHMNCPVNGNCGTFPGFGVIVSRDGGQTWDQQAPLDAGHAMGLAVSPTNEAVAYAALVDGGLYRTQNAGLSWQLINPAPGQNPEKAPNQTPVLATLALDPQNQNRLLMGFWNGGVARSEDGGLNWTSSSAGMAPETDVLDIVFDPANPDVVYAGTLDGGVYLSLNGGTSWTAYNEGLLNKAARRLAISADGGVLYMASEGAGVYRLGSPPPGIFLPLVLRSGN